MEGYTKPEGCCDESFDMAKLMFEKFDADHSGNIDKEEGKNMFISELKRLG